jgi:heme exporter protein D
MEEFLRMGGYAKFVWPAYGVSALAIGGLVFAVWRRSRKLRRKLKDLENGRRPDGETGAL